METASVVSDWLLCRLASGSCAGRDVVEGNIEVGCVIGDTLLRLVLGNRLQQIFGNSTDCCLIASASLCDFVSGTTRQPHFENLAVPLLLVVLHHSRQPFADSLLANGQRVRDVLVAAPVSVERLCCGFLVVIVWLNHGVIVDGHNRHRIWRDVLDSDEDKAPEIREMAFADRIAVEEFMINRQLSRRNVSDAVQVKLALKLKPII